MIASKFLARGAVGRFSGHQWPLPIGSTRGEWVVVESALVSCLSGIHACRPSDLPSWIDDELWEIELGEPVEAGLSFVMAPRGRLVARVDAWTDEVALEFAKACTLRAREQAFRALSQHGLTAEAQRIVSSVGLDSIQYEGAAISRRSGGEPAQAAAFAADAVSLLSGRRPEMPRDNRVPEPTRSASATAANLGFVVAHTAGLYAADSSAAADAYERGFASERDWQVEWLRATLDLRH